MMIIHMHTKKEKKVYPYFESEISSLSSRGLFWVPFSPPIFKFLITIGTKESELIWSFTVSR